MNKCRLIHFGLVVFMVSMIFQQTGCGNIKGKSNTETKDNIKVFTSYFAIKNDSMNKNNAVQNLIAEKTGAKCIETWLDDNKTAADEISDMIISEDYPDFIFGGIEQQRLIEAGALIPIDEYWDDYSNLKAFYTEDKWNKLRADDGHIYMIPQFGNVNMYDTSVEHNDEAFWIQVKVLKWAGYPEINTLDEYFDLLERYIEANPNSADGTPNIGYEILTDGYLYFCLENPPQFLDGYPNDGACIVDEEKLEAIDYNTTDTAKKWFEKLNEEYHKDLIDPECFVLTKDQYFDKIRSGKVLGMVDQYWNFRSAADSLPKDCQYVPLGIVIEEGIEEHYHSAAAFDSSQGLGISVDCEDIEGAMKFIDDLLSPEILTLRTWGREGIEYYVDKDGVFYRTAEQRNFFLDPEYTANNLCDYNYFPFYDGMAMDGINAYSPANQSAEFYDKLSSIMKECFSEYGVQTFTEMLNKSEENKPWFPVWSYSNTFTTDTTYGKAKEDMDTVKHEYLPKVVMSNDFEASWNEYMDVYNSRCDVKAYLDELTAYIRKSVGNQ